MAVVEQQTSEKKEKKSSVLGWIGFIIVLIGIFIIFRYVISFTVVSGDSMNPTLEDGDIVFTSNFFYDVERNDIVIYQDDSGFQVIKRIIGMPNETIEIKQGIVYVDGLPIDEQNVVGTSNDMDEMVIEENTYFVIGDNREPGASLDSRSSDVGTISIDKIQGEAMFRPLPFKWF